MPSIVFYVKKYAQCLLSAALILLIAINGVTRAQTLTNAEAIKGESMALFATEAVFADVSVSAKSAVLIECESGEIIFGKNADARMPMASTTKIMTALVVLNSVPLSETVKISSTACGIEGSSVYLRAGETFTVEELLYALLLSSANDAATALALHVCGSVEAFAEKMNETAASLGLSHTHFMNPHGLHHEEHYTTAYDLALIARAACENENFRKITSTYKTIIRRDSKESARLLVNHNRLLRSYEGCFGIKTGFTKTSGRCLVSGAERDGLSFIAVTLNAPDDWNDHKKLFDAAFSLYKKVCVCKEGEIEYALPLTGSYQPNVICTNACSVTLILAKDTQSKITYKIFTRRFEFAPVLQGQTVGRIVFFLGGREIAACPLVAAYSAAKIK